MISVIVPIYNIADCLSDCFDSLRNQNNTDFEVIMVNDGSTDNSQEVCERYVSLDSRFHLYSKANGGVSSARNFGLKKAQGQWIAFVDGDDLTDPDYLTLPEGCKHFDVIEKSYQIKKDSNILFSNIIPQNILIESNQAFLRYYSKHIRNNSAALWNKIIRREIIGDSEFDETKKMGEDFLFFLSIVSKINTYFISPVGCYTYIRRDDSSATIIDANYKSRVKSLFENIRAVNFITRQEGVPQLGVSIIYITYIPYLMRLRKYLNAADWIRVFFMLLKIPFNNNSLMSTKDIKYSIILPIISFRHRLFGR